MKYDVAVIGGGASGLVASISAKTAKPSASVIVIEKLAKTGRKIIASGNGKCNLSNLDISEKNYHGSVNAMRVINSMPDYKEFFTDILGVLCVNGSEGRAGGVYPRSNSSTTVLNALRMKMQELGIEELCDCGITAINPTKQGFELAHKNGTVFCRKLIVAAGGYASPSFGTDGSVIRLLKDMGYVTSKICPAVAPLRVNPESVKGLKGVRVKGEISAVSDGKILRTEKGELQFNENNISGICVFNLAYLFQKYEGKLMLRADLMPDITQNQLAEYICGIRKSRANQPLEELLTGAFFKNLAVYLVKKSVNRPLTDKISTLKNSEINKIIGNIKSLEFEVTGCSPWQNAQATTGGIVASQIDGNLQSVKHRGMYLCGEILDVVGDCGGYNLQWAWSSGFLAGRKAVSDDKSK
ncbi:MAG: aminoacetone oxidase family FAD-binding enzyme [Ruminococcus flavefaciens]|nr:aminoacetone oxidase family FAD-binding enzyme [Ruminococcus flavefaciens]MCM1229807.1 aminoacetone oxidase family FAD-binding enzyme [Ruminococcus flavefaciens]